MDAKTLSKEQVSALYYALDSIDNAEPNATTIEEAYQQLIESGLPPMLSFDDELVQLYLSENLLISGKRPHSQVHPNPNLTNQPPIH